MTSCGGKTRPRCVPQIGAELAISIPLKLITQEKRVACRRCAAADLPLVEALHVVVVRSARYAYSLWCVY